MSAKTLTAPLDRLKLVVQSRGSLGNEAVAQYGGPFTALTRMVKQEGFLALWRGNVAMMCIQGGSFASNFMFLDLYKKGCKKVIGDQQPFLTSFVSGALAGGTALTLFHPFGLMRTKLALDMGQSHQRLYPNGMRDVFRQSVQTNGFRSLFQGYGVALASVSLYRMVYLGGYDYIKGKLVVRRRQSNRSNPKTTPKDTSKLPFAERLVAAQAISMVASTVHYPLDTVRRRLMMQSDATVKTYSGTKDCFVQIFRQEGFKGYYRGLGTNYIRSTGAALLLVSYDFLNDALMNFDPTELTSSLSKVTLR